MKTMGLQPRTSREIPLCARGASTAVAASGFSGLRRRRRRWGRCASATEHPSPRTLLQGKNDVFMLLTATNSGFRLKTTTEGNLSVYRLPLADGMAYKSQLSAAATATVDEERETIKHAHPLSSFSDW
uniref:Uncharacterized protein n=1 Tax=Oryza glumipatula TaxID=40148 RepID=A0A0D9ZKQ0_9ORYZ